MNSDAAAGAVIAVVRGETETEVEVEGGENVKRQGRVRRQRIKKKKQRNKDTERKRCRQCGKSTHATRSPGHDRPAVSPLSQPLSPFPFVLLNMLPLSMGDGKEREKRKIERKKAAQCWRRGESVR